MRSRLIRRSLGLFAVLFLVIIVSRCRTASTQNDSEVLAETSAKTWFAKDGTGKPCEVPATACQQFDDAKDFVDLCVANGFQAKTCGCDVRCSGQVPAGAQTPKADPAAEKLAADAKALACPEDAKTYIQDTVAGLRAGTSLSRCSESHVCNGNLGWCTADERRTTTKLRALAGGKCEQEVLNGVCKDGYLDSLQCPEGNIQKLSSVWAEFYNRESGAKRCIRNFICSDDKGASCVAQDLTQAKAIKNAIDADGCEYWLRVYCSIGVKTW